MKRPRKLLLDRHRSAEPRLDAVRQNALARLAVGHGTAIASVVPNAWREFLLSCRWHLAGMAAAWLVIALLNVEPSNAPTVVTAARRDTPSAHQLVADLRENRRQLAELFEPPAADATPPPPIFVPRRRSECASSIAVV